jgi:hypothetical protein
MKAMEPRPLTRPFGEPLDLEMLLDFAEVDEIDLDEAIQWWDETASDEWIGVLDDD